MIDTQDDVRRMLADGVDRLLEREYGFEQRDAMRKAMATGQGLDKSVLWPRLEELGIFMLAADKDAVQDPASLGHMSVVAEAMGRGLAIEPALPAMLGARLAALAGTAGVLADGQLAVVAPSILHGRESGFGAEAMDGGWRLSGQEDVWLGGDAAQILLLSARDMQGVPHLFAMPADQPGVTCTPYQLFDGRGAANVALNSVETNPAYLVAQGEALADAFERIELEASLLNACDAVGAMRGANALTLEQLQTRHQFGRPIGAFQALQHRMVDMSLVLELADALVAQAMVAACNGPDAGGWRLACGALVRTALSSRQIAEETVQMHGGMGLTEEYPAAHYFARLTSFELLYPAEEWTERFARLAPLDKAA
ncbi:acyl-CoA dehydrogenase family protein [Altericroceibacterium endophyticum]|uniref:Acyl-CoA dehydrogenase/oxidase C-terminal domain-containing protein n=1 Tax=Altericroceibacterium endophyticum TaxID=1808508 RepID=A0A6I4T7A5_9SPHN|nr:acyl-CoA dehydrogenase family protein [Altericroceibacterium endophyticum]MXO66836.1 hypothetical protein [Altericroceibacterium endophyticum]